MTASFSSCGGYRYRLDRTIDMFNGPIIGFCLHNPSTANAESDDPTSRRGIGFAKLWGGSRLIFVNLWAGIATKPRDLWAMDDPVGPENDRFIVEAVNEIARSGGFVIAAWGAISPPAAKQLQAQNRTSEVSTIIRDQGCELRALARNRDGSPKHPLYVKKETVVAPWP